MFCTTTSPIQPARPFPEKWRATRSACYGTFNAALTTAYGIWPKPQSESAPRRTVVGFRQAPGHVAFLHEGEKVVHNMDQCVYQAQRATVRCSDVSECGSYRMNRHRYEFC
jgi:hypothetical protein